MKAIRLAARKLFRKGEHTTTRILSLATGLTFGLILLSEVFFYFSVDSFYPDSKRIYVVNENFKADKQSDKMTTHPLVSGAIGPGLKAEVPGIEAATRLNSIGTMVFYSEDNRGFNAHFVLADEHLPKVLPRPMISGLAEEILKTPMNCMVSDEIAQKMGGNVVGQVIEINEFPGKKLTIGGIFKSLPENTNFLYDIAISMVSTAQFTWDGTENWLGNDRYYTCVKLEKAISPESLAPAVRKMQEKHQNIKELELKHGVVLKYSFEAIQKIFVNQQKNILFILSAIAFIVLFVAVMNYMLLTLSTLAVRSKTLAIYKCYGAEKQNLHGMIFAESSLNFILSLLVALALILLFKPIAEAQLGHSLQAALNRQVIVPLLLILVFLVFVISYFTGRIFTKIPVAAAFRSYQQSKTKWKKALLAVQFISASLILTILVVVGLQFEKIKNTDHGYSAENVYYTEVSGMDPHKIEAVLNDLIALPEVKNAGFGCDVPIYGAAGNNILSPDGERVLFNLADFYYIDENYFSILDIPVIEGKGFKKEESSRQDVMISRNAAELLILNNGWHDGVIGRSISITEHGDNFRISGIYPDIIEKLISADENRPSVFFYMPREKFIETLEADPSFSFLILIKTVEGNHPNIMNKFSEIINRAMPKGEIKLYSLEAEKDNAYRYHKSFRNAIYAGSLVVLLVTVMGVLGYLNDEITRQRKNIAIRKINGATANDIIHFFIYRIGSIAVPCVIFGVATGFLLARSWMQNFPVQISLSWWIFVLAGGFVLLLTGVVTTMNSLKTASSNPIDSLRYE